MSNGLPPVQNLNIGMVKDAMNDDIIKTIHKMFPVAVLQTAAFAKRFKAGSRLQTAKNVWEFMKRKITYKRDPNEFQMIRYPNRFVNDGDGDCKSYALFAASTLANLGFPVAFRYAGYKDGSTTPTHVYMVTKDESGNEIIVDGVYNKFNAEKSAKFKKDYPMEVLALAGVNDDIGKLKFGKIAKRLLVPDPGLHLLLKRIKHLKPKQRERLAKKLKMLGKLTPGLEKKLLGHLLNNKRLMKVALSDSLLSDPGMVSGIAGKKKRKGKFFKKIGKGLKNFAQLNKKLALIPMRKSFLALVNLNVRGIAKKLSLGLKQKPGKIEKLWKRLGGNVNVLNKAIARGAKKKPLLGAKKSLRGLFGIEGVLNGIGGIGVAPAALLVAAGTVLTAFASILKSIKGDKGSKEDAQADSELNDTLSEAKEVADPKLLNDIQSGAPLGPAGGSNSADESGEDKPGDDSGKDDDEGASGETPKWLLPAAAVAAFLMFK